MEARIKQRLIGAGVLIALAVIFIPMIFESSHSSIPEPITYTTDIPTSPIAITAPLPDTQQAPTYDSSAENNVNNPTEVATATEVNIVIQQEETPAVATTTAVTKSTQNASTSMSVSINNTAEKQATTKTTTVNQEAGWAVQVASFANARNADVLAKKLKTHGFPVYTQKSIQGKHLIRVYVGPQPERKDAVLVMNQLQQTVHLHGFVIHINPTS